jgi:hypothetical protein
LDGVLAKEQPQQFFDELVASWETVPTPLA